MEPWQMAQQLKALLETVTWETGSDGVADVVFGSQGSVACFAGQPTTEQIPEGLPSALIIAGDGTADDEHPELITQDFTIFVVVQVEGDPQGEFAIIGGAAPDLDESFGRGVMEVARRVRTAVGDLKGSDGAKIMAGQVSFQGADTFGDQRHVAFASVTVSAKCTSQLHYAEPQQIELDGTTWTWLGPHCSDRFDFVEYVFGYVTGTAPVATVAELTAELYTGPDATYSVASVSGRVYQVFACYSARRQTQAAGSPPSIEGYSPGDRVGSYLAT